MFQRLVPLFTLTVAAASCAGRQPSVANAGKTTVQVSGVWDALSRATINEGAGAGDTRIEKQEWHLAQTGDAITGYYIAALTFVSGDGRPYACNRESQFSALQRYDVSGKVRGGTVEIQEVAQRSGQGRCAPGLRRLMRYAGNLQGDVLTLVAGEQRQTLYRSKESPEHRPTPDFDTVLADEQATDASFPGMAGLADSPPTATAAVSSPPADVSGLWIWEHRGSAPDGDEKQEREEWHVAQDGTKITGYYDRIVHQVSSDGHAYKCSMSLDFQIATRYQISGEVRGDQVIIYENSFEILQPSACDNGKRRLDAYEGHVSPEELRLIWGVGGQVLHRPRPDVPTQRF